MYQFSKLSNGIRIVSEQIPYLKSVCVGVWVKNAVELENELGYAHFIEHMLFKGTENKNAAEIALSIDEIGGQMNAFTSKECTCFYTKTMDRHLETAVSVLGDIINHSLFSKENIETEKNVVLEEIQMYEDSPDELVHDLAVEKSFSGDPYGMPILGTRQTIENLDRDSLLRYKDRCYCGSNIVIAAAGNFSQKELTSLLEQYFGELAPGDSVGEAISAAQFHAGSIVREKEIGQTHLVLSVEGYPLGSEELYSLAVINNIFGSGMSSRLFQEIREKNGLAYSVFAYPTSHKRGGLFSIYAGTSPKSASLVVDKIVSEMERIYQEGLTDEELKRGKTQLAAGYVLSGEAASSKMNHIGKSELLLGRILTEQESLSRIEKVDQASVRRVLDKVFHNDQWNLSVVGKIEPDLKDKLL